MNTLMPKTVSVSDIQKNYRKIFDDVRKTKEPVIVLSNNKPDVVIMDIKILESLNKKLEEAEIEDTLRVVEEGRREYEEGKTIKANSLADLI
ncbi:MAG: type II toxin-antitoxin system Phd/YefM family antitoxin [Candidatus Daviesbacteria bacterium]|nr:type II toxin-antitoxin system Phd/YefM family antitoxin [Candidatus Daviesbacteria bacterium]